MHWVLCSLFIHFYWVFCEAWCMNPRVSHLHSMLVPLFFFFKSIIIQGQVSLFSWGLLFLGLDIVEKPDPRISNFIAVWVWMHGAAGGWRLLSFLGGHSFLSLLLLVFCSLSEVLVMRCNCCTVFCFEHWPPIELHPCETFLRLILTLSLILFLWPSCVDWPAHSWKERILLRGRESNIRSNSVYVCFL